MRILAACFQCKKPSLVYGQLRDSGIVQIICDAGHKSNCVSSLERFEYLFESGLLAYVSGFEREAVSSLSASLERFFEYYVRVISREKEIDHDKFALAWKSLSDQSERQLGAFLLVHLLETREPFVVNGKMVKFRNKVIHKGHIPTLTEVRTYAAFIYDTIMGLRTYLEDVAKETVSQLRRELHLSRSRAVDANSLQSSMGTVVSLSIVEGEELSLDRQLKRLRDDGVSFVPSIVELGNDV